MKLGAIQKLIIEYVKMGNGKPVYIGTLTRSSFFNGYELGEIEKSIKRLVSRGILVRVPGPIKKYVLAEEN